MGRTIVETPESQKKDKVNNIWKLVKICRRKEPQGQEGRALQDEPRGDEVGENLRFKYCPHTNQPLKIKPHKYNNEKISSVRTSLPTPWAPMRAAETLARWATAIALAPSLLPLPRPLLPVVELAAPIEH